MPWFYYSGTVGTSIPVKKGLSVFVKSHTRVEIIETNSHKVKTLKKKGVLRRCGRPPGISKNVAQEPIVKKGDIAAVTPKSAMAKVIAEKGVTSNKSQAPKKPKGAPEMTEGELRAPVTKEPAQSDPSKESTSDSDSSSDVSKTNDGPVEVLSKVDGSPDENEGGAKDSKKKKRKHRTK